MPITWFNERPKECIVTLTPGNITLNKPATTFFESAYSVMLGIDIDQRLVIIKPLTKTQYLRHDVPDTKKYRITVRSSYSRITNKAFINEVSKLFDLVLPPEGRKYVSLWSNKDNILVVDLKEEIK